MNIAGLVDAGLTALELPADPVTARGVALHLSRLAAMSALVLDVTLPDEVEPPARFEP